MNKQGYIPELLPSQRKTLAIAISAAIAGANTVQAQQVLEEVVVTATKRAQSAQDIPMAITAFTDADIVREGFKTLDDYAGQIPGLTANRREPGGSNVVMRGCATTAVSFGEEATTAVYLDEQPITSAGTNPDPRLVDVNRVEALSGPQGSLFGSAAQCGTLRIITNKAEPNEFEGWVDATASLVEHGDVGYDLSGMVNIPLIEDKLAIRLVGFYAEEAGYIDNIAANSLGPSFAVPATTGGPYDNSAFVGEDVNTSDVYGGRVGLRWTPNENWTIDAQAIYQKTESEGFGDVDLSDDLHAGIAIGELEQVRFGQDKWDDEWYQLSLTTEARLGFADLTVTGSYMNRKLRYDTDATAYALFYSQLNGTAGGVYDFGERTNFANEDDELDNWTFEARLATPADSDSRWAGIVGFFYDQSETDAVFTSNGVGLSDNCVAAAAANPGCYAHHAYASYLHYFYFGTFQHLSDNWWTGVYNDIITQKAVFGEISFDLTENLTITAGGRWFEIEDEIKARTGNGVNLGQFGDGTFVCGTDAEKATWQATSVTTPTTTTSGGTTTTTFWTGGTPASRDVHVCYNDSRASGKESDWVPKVNATYRFNDDLMAYFTFSEGFRRGGTNSAKNGPYAIGGAFHKYDGDTLKNYEAGIKSTWLNGRFQLNLTGYHMIWEDIQVQALDTSGFFSIGIINLTEAEINGFEADFAWLPAEGWDVRGTLGYNDAEVTGDDTVFGITIPSGTRLPLMPDVKSSLSVEYTLQREILGAEPYVQGTWTYEGESLNATPGVGGSQATGLIRTHDSYSLLNLRAGLNGDDWSASFYINNVTDKVAEQLFNERWIQTRLTVNQPRTFGINFRKNFGK